LPEKDAARTATNLALARLEGEFLLKELTARARLPGHGFPTDVIPFVPITISDLKRQSSADKQSREDGLWTWREYPSRNLAIAISEYAPGAKVVIAGADLERIPFLRPAGFAVALYFEPHNDVSDVGGPQPEPRGSRPVAPRGSRNTTPCGAQRRIRDRSAGTLI